MDKEKLKEKVIIEGFEYLKDYFNSDKIMEIYNNLMLRYCSEYSFIIVKNNYKRYHNFFEFLMYDAAFGQFNADEIDSVDVNAYDKFIGVFVNNMDNSDEITLTVKSFNNIYDYLNIIVTRYFMPMGYLTYEQFVNDFIDMIP